MHCPDVVSLKQFYASPTGAVAARMMWRALMECWPRAAHGESTLALGYPVPFLPEVQEAETTTFIVMPAQQGALYWPPAQANRVALSHEALLPFPDNSFNRVIAVHLVEHSEHALPLMQEIHRVLAPSGRALIVVPNRHGLWSHAAGNPFGFGKPYSAGQMCELLSQSELTYLRHMTALFMPPVSARLVHRAARMVEVMGRVACPMLGGVLLVEAEKQIYASLREPVRARSRVSITPLPATARASLRADRP